MYRQSAAVRLYIRALRMNPQQVLFYSRIAPGAAGNWSSNSPYTLFRATFKDKSKDTIGPGVLKKEMKEWTFYSLDLANAQAPDPKVDDRFVDANNVGWSIKSIDEVIMNSAFIMTCIQELPTNTPIN